VTGHPEREMSYRQVLAVTVLAALWVLVVFALVYLRVWGPW
jgi:hypothetical protein